MVDYADDLGRKELLKSAYRKIEELRARLKVSEGRQSEPVAIVGMGCRFPGGVTDADSFWQLLSTGKDGVTEIPADRWNVDAYYDPDPDAPGKMYARRGGFIGSVREFDPLFFHVSPQEASSMDPQQRVLLEVTWEALENAGLAPDRLAGTQTGVFVGIAGLDYTMIAFAAKQDLLDATHVATGSSHSIAAGRISYFFGLRGPCMAIDTACAAGLTSVHLAVQSLRNGESRMALAASVNLVISPESNVAVCKARMLSADGKCKTFDAAADGYVRSEGCGVMVLKLLSQAEADGDRILALIRGSACNQDGRTNGITAPNGNAQREVIQAALAASGLSPHDIDYVETHGTGTSLGDPIEVQALGEVFAPNRAADRKLVLGAVKTNIGHLESAAGMASLCKVILALQKEQIPPNLHLHNPNPLISWNSLPFLTPTELIPWPASSDRRLAGVSAFGFSGTNVHMILEQAPLRAPAANLQDRPCHLLTLSAQSPKALRELAERHLDFLTEKPAANLADICFTANTGRAHFPHRLALVASTLEELKDELETKLGNCAQPAGLLNSAPSQSSRLGLFIASESLSEIHRLLYHQSTVFKAAIDACASVAAEFFSVPLPAIFQKPLAPSTPAPSSPALDKVVSFALGYAMAAQWRDWGLNPDALSGCGVGCWVATVLAGAISLHDGLRLTLDPHSVKRTAIAWQTPQIMLLSSVTGVLLTRDGLKTLAEPESAGARSSEMLKLNAGFEREGIRVVLAIGAALPGTSSFPDRPANLPLILNLHSGCDWPALLGTVGGLYQAGVPIDWRKFESPWRRKRLALPTYPFQRQDCWLKFEPSAPARKSLLKELHPLLGRRLQSPQFRDEIVFEAEFDTGRMPFMKDHQLFSTVVVPTTVMLEMSLAAGRIALKQREISVDDLVIEQPLLLPDGHTSLVQTVLTPEGNDTWSFVIMSAELHKPEGEAAWKRHCSGMLKPFTNPAAQVAGPNILSRLQSRHDQPMDPDWFYSLLKEAGVNYGRSFSLVRSIGRGEDGTLVFLQIPRDMAHPVSPYAVYPGLLDAAIQSLGTSHLLAPENSEVYMPVAIERYRLFQDGLREVWCHGTFRPETVGHPDTMVGDVQLYSITGESVGELRGVHLKRNVRKQFMQEVLERRLTDWLYETRWEPLPALPPAGPVAGSWLIVAAANPLADHFATLVEQQRGRAIIAQPGAAFSRESRDRFTLRFDSSGDYDELLRAIAGEALLGVVYFAASQLEGGATHSVPRLAGSTTARLLHLTQALTRNGGGDLPSLALVTEGFQTPDMSEPSSLAGGAAWGLGRVIARELPDLRCKLIDLDPSVPPHRAAAILADELASNSEENQVALGEGKRLGLRLEHASPLLIARKNLPGAGSRRAEPRAALEPFGTYLITGGLGGLGLLVAQGIVAHGARRLVLVGRSAPNPAAEKVILDLEALGAQVIVARADVANRQQVADLLATHASPSAPLRGVIHAAGLLDDGALLLQDWSRFERILSPKIDGAWNLHELTRSMPLDFFVLFSSGAGVFGNPGQSSYAAANVFLDELALARRASGLPALSINWGPWAQVGMAAAMNQRHTQIWDSRGLSTIEPAEGLTILQMLIGQSQTAQVAVLPVEKTAWRQAAGQDVPPLLRNLAIATPAPVKTSSSSRQAAELLRQAAPGERRNVMIGLISEAVLDVFGFDRSRSIPPDQNLTMLGMDSLLAIQLSNRLKTSFAAAIPSTLTFQYPTIEDITDYLLAVLPAGAREKQPSAGEAALGVTNASANFDRQLDPQQAQTILANINQLSNHDVEVLLGALETNGDSA